MKILPSSPRKGLTLRVFDFHFLTPDPGRVSAFDHARRKLIKSSLRPRRRKSCSSLDENGQVQLFDFEQAGLDDARQKLGPELGAEFVRTYFQERRRAGLRVFNDPAEIAAIVDILEGHSQQRL